MLIRILGGREASGFGRELGEWLSRLMWGVDQVEGIGMGFG